MCLEDKTEADALVRGSLATFLGEVVLDNEQCGRQRCAVVLVVVVEFGHSCVELCPGLNVVSLHE